MADGKRGDQLPREVLLGSVTPQRSAADTSASANSPASVQRALGFLASERMITSTMEHKKVTLPAFMMTVRQGMASDADDVAPLA